VNEWEIAAAALAVALIPCLAVCLLSSPAHGLVALELGGVLASTILMLLAEGLHRQPFIDLAVVLAPLSLISSLFFARLMERHLD
jgi:multisubunit Na+/H+ antiporter MnhF subunit